MEERISKDNKNNNIGNGIRMSTSIYLYLSSYSTYLTNRYEKNICFNCNR